MTCTERPALYSLTDGISSFDEFGTQRVAAAKWCLHAYRSERVGYDAAITETADGFATMLTNGRTLVGTRQEVGA